MGVLLIFLFAQALGGMLARNIKRQLSGSPVRLAHFPLWAL